MGPVANGRGGEEEENLRAIKTLRYIFDSFAQQSCDSDEREHQWGSAEGSLEVKCVYRVKPREGVSWIGGDR